MADIELVIKIPEEEYRWIKKSDKTVFADVASKECMLHAIKNGTPLPKWHGDLIDAKDLRQDIIAHKYSINFCEEHNIDQSINVGMLNILLADAPTIIEADKENKE